MKISIIGYSGSGKSTLAKTLGRFYQVEVLHLDRVNFIENWERRDLKQSQEIVDAFLKKDGWVIDGNYQDINQNERFKHSDVILFMNFPRRICFPQAFLRFWRNRHGYRDDVGVGCKEKFDFEFMWWILVEGRSKKYKKRYQDIIDTYPDKMVILKNHSDTKAYLNGLGIHTPENL